MESVSIIGFGRFGKTLYQLLKDDFSLTLYDINKKAFEGVRLAKKTKIARYLREVYENNSVFFAVPISRFEEVVSSHKVFFKNHLLIDVLSVKLYPVDIFKKYLKGTKTQALLTHPLFGPDSAQNGFVGLPIVIDAFMAEKEAYTFWKKYFIRKGLCVVEISPREHDKLAASSQGVAHFIGRLLREFGFQETVADTLGATKLHELQEQTCNDAYQLFYDLQVYNPYAKRMRLRFGYTYDKLYNRLLPKRVSAQRVFYGIQGGEGSFNEEAILDYTGRHHIGASIIKYLYTTEKVLRSLHRGDIDYGLFAIHNSVGGIVDESLYAMARYKFKIVEEFVIPVRHHLMKKRRIDPQDIRAIMAHPQAFKQCRRTLREKYPAIPLKSGKGDMIDTAFAAHALSEGRLSSNTAILGPRRLSKLYNLEIFDENLQDDKENYTSFLLVER